MSGVCDEYSDDGEYDYDDLDPAAKRVRAAWETRLHDVLSSAHSRPYRSEASFRRLISTPATLPQLSVRGHRCPLPLQAETAHELSSSGERVFLAPGLFAFDASAVSLAGPPWFHLRTNAARDGIAELGLELTAQTSLRQLLVQCVGSSSALVARPSDASAFGILLIQLPVAGGHEGGEIDICFGSERKSFHTGGPESDDSSSIAAAAFFSDCACTLRPITDGLRLLLVYDLLLPKGHSGPLPTAASARAAVQPLTDIVREWEAAKGAPKLLAFALKAPCPKGGAVSFEGLSGADASVAKLLLACPALDCQLVSFNKTVSRELNRPERDYGDECERFMFGRGEFGSGGSDSDGDVEVGAVIERDYSTTGHMAAGDQKPAAVVEISRRSFLDPAGPGLKVDAPGEIKDECEFQEETWRIQALVFWPRTKPPAGLSGGDCRNNSVFTYTLTAASDALAAWGGAPSPKARAALKALAACGLADPIRCFAAETVPYQYHSSYSFHQQAAPQRIGPLRLLNAAEVLEVLERAFAACTRAAGDSCPAAAAAEAAAEQSAAAAEAAAVAAAAAAAAAAARASALATAAAAAAARRAAEAAQPAGRAKKGKGKKAVAAAVPAAAAAAPAVALAPPARARAPAAATAAVSPVMEVRDAALRLLQAMAAAAERQQHKCTFTAGAALASFLDAAYAALPAADAAAILSAATKLLCAGAGASPLLMLDCAQALWDPAARSSVTKHVLSAALASAASEATVTALAAFLASDSGKEFAPVGGKLLVESVMALLSDRKASFWGRAAAVPRLLSACSTGASPAERTALETAAVALLTAAADANAGAAQAALNAASALQRGPLRLSAECAVVQAMAAQVASEVAAAQRAPPGSSAFKALAASARPTVSAIAAFVVSAVAGRRDVFAESPALAKAVASAFCALLGDRTKPPAVTTLLATIAPAAKLLPASSPDADRVRAAAAALVAFAAPLADDCCFDALRLLWTPELREGGARAAVAAALGRSLLWSQPVASVKGTAEKVAAVLYSPEFRFERAKHPKVSELHAHLARQPSVSAGARAGDPGARAVLQARVAALRKQTAGGAPVFEGWAQPDAFFPERADIQAFLCGPTQEQTFLGFPGIREARNFTMKHFSTWEGDGWAARADSGGSGKKAFVRVTKTNCDFSKRESAYRASAAMLLKLQKVLQHPQQPPAKKEERATGGEGCAAGAGTGSAAATPAPGAGAAGGASGSGAGK